ncbi:pendrin-like [Discoglossus pictus]
MSGSKGTQYLVSRPIYTQQAFKEENEKKDIVQKTLADRMKKSCRCTSKRALRVCKTVLPILEWLPKYRWKEWFIHDTISGVSTGLVITLQGLALALLTYVPVGYGLYTAFFPILTYFFLGTSKHLSIAPFAVTCSMVGTVVLSMAPDDKFIIQDNSTDTNGTVIDTNARDQARVIIAGTLCVLIGIIQFLLGVCRVGFVVRYLSNPLVSGFTTAATFSIFVGQLKTVLNVPTKNYQGILSTIYLLIDIFDHIGKTNIADLIAGLLTFVVCIVVKEVNERFPRIFRIPIPIEVIVTVVATGVSYAANLNAKYNANIVKFIPAGFKPPMAPDVSMFSQMIGPAFSIGLISYAVAVSIGKVYATKHQYEIDGNQEFIAFGISNIFCGIFSGFVTATAISSTAIQESCGGKTQIAGLISAAIVLIVIEALGFLLEPLQKSVLAALIIASMKGVTKHIAAFPVLYRENKWDAAVWMFTCIATILLGLDVGLLAGLIFGLATIVLRVQFPTCSSLGNVPDTEQYKPIKQYQNIVEPAGVKIVRFSGGIFYGNIDGLKNGIKKILGFDTNKVFNKRAKALMNIHQLLKKGKLHATKNGVISEIGVDNKGFEADQDPEDPENIENQKVESKEVEIHVDWNSNIPVKVSVPKVTIHSVIFDFGLINFVDIVAVRSLKLIYNEFKKIDVDMYIAGCDDEIFKKLRVGSFFDDVITTDIMFLTIHDAILYLEEQRKLCEGRDPLMERISVMKESNELEDFEIAHPQEHELDAQEEALRQIM